MRVSFMKISLASLFLASILGITGCSSLLSALGGSSLDAGQENTYRELAVQYLKDNYSDIINADDLNYMRVATVDMDKSSLVKVTFSYSDLGTMHILNVQASPVDDIDYVMHSTEAFEKIEGIADEIFGEDCYFEGSKLACFFAPSDEGYSSSGDMLEKFGVLPFGLGIVLDSGNLGERDALVSSFEARLEEENIFQPYHIFFYDDVRTLARDFSLDKCLSDAASSNSKPNFIAMSAHTTENGIIMTTSYEKKADNA